MLAMEETIFGIGEISSNLLHPSLVGTGRTAGEMNTESFQLHDKQQVEGDQATLGPDFDRRKVNRRQHVPVGFEKRAPCGLPLSVGRWLDTVCFEDVPHCPGGDVVADIGQSALNAVVTPGRVLFGEPQVRSTMTWRIRGLPTDLRFRL